MGIINLIFQSDIIIKVILLILLGFSVGTWAIFISKLIIFKKIESESFIFYTKFKGLKSMKEIDEVSSYTYNGYITNIYLAGKNIDKNFSKKNIEEIKRTMIMERDDIIEKISTKTQFIATSASVTPFIGLFGTVWGIMDSFMGLAVDHSSTISAVAPGIAGALITTALGLFAAIPSVIFYNYISRKIDKIEHNSNKFIQEFINKISKN
jgi:biopolymer transport protein TolQ